VLVPSFQNFTVIPAGPLSNLHNVTLLVEGNLLINVSDANSFLTWPVDDTGVAIDMLAFWNCSDIFVTTSSGTLNRNGWGVLDGWGYDWWWFVLLGGEDNRPNLISTEGVARMTVTHLRMTNSPQFHAYMHDVLDLEMYGIDIYVDVEAQQAMLRSQGLLTDGKAFDAAVSLSKLERHMAAAGPTSPRALARFAERLQALNELSDAGTALPAGIPVFPLNTDGIDPAGRNVYIHDSNITCFDDAVALKPLNSWSGVVAGPCTTNVTVDHVNIIFGVGATIGSVPPDVGVNCISNSTFSNIRFTTPIKAMYVKPNPGTVGTGVIDGITYENITGSNTLWWPLYVSTQQQKQPGNGSDTGCSFWFPLGNSTCPLQPRVPVTNMRFKNIALTDNLLSAGIIRCVNETAGHGIPGWAPCSGWEFDNVVITSLTNWPLGPGADGNGTYMCEGIVDPLFTGGSVPVPTCT